MKILITGCAGFIGSSLCDKLCKRGDLIIGIDNLNSYYDIQKKQKNLKKLNKYNNFTFIKDDLITTNIIKEHNFDTVVNIGAIAGVRNSIQNPEIYIRTNTEGQIHLLKECVENKVKHFVYASSSSVYGNNKIPFNEKDDIIDQTSPYALSKLFSEKIAEFYSKNYNISTIGLRFFTVYGPNGRPDMAPYKFLKAIIDEKPLDKYGDGLSGRDYTYIDDIVDGIISAIDNKMNKKCEIYNLGNSESISLNKFIETCEKVVGKKAIINQMDKQEGDTYMTCADITKAKNDLNYNPKIKLEEGLKMTYQSFLN